VSPEAPATRRGVYPRYQWTQVLVDETNDDNVIYADFSQYGGAKTVAAAA